MRKERILEKLRLLSEEELNRMIELYRQRIRCTPKGDELFGLPQDVLKKLEDKHHARSDENWISFVEQLPRRLTLLSRTGKELMEHAKKVYLENCYAEDNTFRVLLRSAIEYASAYKVRPMLFAGAPGCGKSHAVDVYGKMIGLPTYHVDAPLISHGSGLSGEAGSYQNASCGAVVSGMIRTGSCNYIMKVEEIDKIGHPTTQASLDDQFLKFIDQDAVCFRDNRLGFDVDASHIIVLFTANDLSKVSRPLVDRCEVIEFAPPTKDHIARVMKSSFIPKSLCDLKCMDRIVFSEDAVDYAIDHVWDSGERSFRQYQNLLSRCISAGNCRSIEKEDCIVIGCDDVKEVISAYNGGKERSSGRIGFL